jgi:hypothetical protein
MTTTLSIIKRYQRYGLTFMAIAILSFSLYSCTKTGGETSPPVDPSNKAQLAAALRNSFPQGSQTVDGIPPVSSPEDSGRPTISILGSNTSQVESGSTLQSIQFNVNNITSPRLASTSENNRGCYVSLTGFTDFYWDVPAPAGTPATWTLPISIPSDMLPGTFTLQICAYNNGLISNTITWTITIINTSNDDNNNGGGNTGSATITVDGVTYKADYCYLTIVSDTVQNSCFENSLLIGFDNKSKILTLYNVPISSGSADFANYCAEYNSDDNRCWNNKTIALYDSNSSDLNSTLAATLSGTISTTGTKSFSLNNLVLNLYNIDAIPNSSLTCGFTGSAINISGTCTYVKL